MTKKSSIIYSILFSVTSIGLLFLAFSLYIRSNDSAVIPLARRFETYKITLEADHIRADESDHLEVDGETLFIYGPGKYHFTGSLQDGQIIVDATSKDSIILEFENVTLHNETSAPIWIKQAKEVTIELTTGSSSHFSDGKTRIESPAGEKLPEACIYARCDLTIQGEDSELLITGNYKEGIHSSDDLFLGEGMVDIQALSSGIKAHDSFTLENCDLRIDATKDGIYSAGPVNLSGGNLQIHSGKYGIFGRECIEADSSCQLNIRNALSPIASNGLIHCVVQ